MKGLTIAALCTLAVQPVLAQGNEPSGSFYLPYCQNMVTAQPKSDYASAVHGATAPALSRRCWCQHDC
jgi:hypothetical protein